MLISPINSVSQDTTLWGDLEYVIFGYLCWFWFWGGNVL